MSRLVIASDGPFLVTAITIPEGTAVTPYTSSALSTPIALPYALPAAANLYLGDGANTVDVTVSLGSWSRTDRIRLRSGRDSAVELNLSDVPLGEVLSVVNAFTAPASFRPSDHGYLAWAYDPALTAGGTILATAGLVVVTKLRLARAAKVTNIHQHVTTGGGTLTANQCLSAIYQGGALKATSANQATAWQSTGITTEVLASPVVLAAGDVYVARVATGSTLPTFARGAATVAANAGIAAAASRFGTADSSITTTFPATLGTVSALAVSYWAALS